MLYALRFVLLCLLMPLFSSESVASWSFKDHRSGWNQAVLAKAYFHHSEMQRQWAWELLGKLSLAGDEKVLDFGCGDGKITAELSHLLGKGKVVGVDISEPMVQMAHICFPPFAYPNLEFKTTKSLALGDVDLRETYDLILSFSVFHLIPDPLEVLIHWKAHLNPSGKIALLIPAGRSESFYQASAEMFVKYNLEIPWTVHTPSEKPTMRTLEGCRFFLEKAGYEIEDIKRIDRDNPFYDLEDLRDWMIGTAAGAWQVPVELAPAFFSDVVSRMYELNPGLIDEEGRVRFKMSRIAVIAHLQDQ